MRVDLGKRLTRLALNNLYVKKDMNINNFKLQNLVFFYFRIMAI